MSKEDKKRSYRRWNFPRHKLKRALDVATAIQNKNNGNPISPSNLSKALNISSGSSTFRNLLSSSIQYGLTEGSYRASLVKLTPLGQSITKPRSATEKIKGLQKAAQIPKSFRSVYTHHSGGKVPEADEFFKNVLETDFDIDRDLVDRFIDILTENGKFSKIYREQNGSLTVILEAEDFIELDTDEEGDNDEYEEFDDEEEDYERQEPKPPKERKIFIAHGKNKIPLEQLKKILDQFDVPYTVAIDEPHSGRPISEKVAELMKECSSAIFIFTADEECVLQDGTKTYRPSDNVVYELGAASILY